VVVLVFAVAIQKGEKQNLALLTKRKNKSLPYSQRGKTNPCPIHKEGKQKKNQKEEKQNSKRGKTKPCTMPFMASCPGTTFYSKGTHSIAREHIL
jgi:hypothetical protein